MSSSALATTTFAPAPTTAWISAARAASRCSIPATTVQTRAIAPAMPVIGQATAQETAGAIVRVTEQVTARAIVGTRAAATGRIRRIETEATPAMPAIA